MGLGHAARMLSAGMRLKSSFEIVYSTYDLAVDFIERHGFKVYRVPPVQYSVFSDGEVDTKTTILRGIGNIANFLLQVKKEIDHISREEPDIVISDSRLSTLIAARLLEIKTLLVSNQLKVRIPVKKITRIKKVFRNISEAYLEKILSTGWSLASKILIPDLPPPYTISKYTVEQKYLHNQKVEFIGPLLIKWPEDYPTKEDIKKKLGFIDKKVLLLSLSGSLTERKSMLYKALEKLKECNRKDLVIVASRGEMGSRNIVKKGNVLIFDWIEDKHLFLKASDLVITHGGHTSILESIVFGAPSVNIPPKTHTERYLNSLAAQELGVAILSSVDDLCWAINEILDSDDVRRRLAEIRLRVRLRGDKRLYEIVEEMLAK